MAKYGYVRVSTAEQNTTRQEVLMQELGVDKVLIDKASGKDTNRPQLNILMDFVTKGDTIIVESISRFARNTKDLLDLIERLKDKGVHFISKKENIDTSTPTGMFMLTVFGAVAQLERDYLRDRQKEGIDIAKKEGKFKGRKKIINTKFDKVYIEWDKGNITAVRAMDLLGMKPNTFYRRVNEYRQQKEGA